MDDAYELLARQKHENESFSEVIRRIVDNKPDIMTFAGVWKMSDKDAHEMKEVIASLRKKATVETLRGNR